MNKKNDTKKQTVLKVQPQEIKLTNLNELLDKRKLSKKKKISKTGKVIGYFFTYLGVFALIISLLINRFVDREYFPDSTIIFIVGVSLFTLLFGFYILIKETR